MGKEFRLPRAPKFTEFLKKKYAGLSIRGPFQRSEPVWKSNNVIVRVWSISDYNGEIGEYVVWPRRPEDADCTRTFIGAIIGFMNSMGSSYIRLAWDNQNVEKVWQRTDINDIPFP